MVVSYKPKKLKLFFCFIFLIIHFSVFSQNNDYLLKYRDGKIDEIIKKIPKVLEQEVFDNPDEKLKPFIEYLLKGIDDPFRKVKIIHDWIVVNIAYDSEALDGLKTSAETMKEIFKEKKTVCRGYTMLFNKIAGMAGIESIEIDGYVRSGNYNVWTGDGNAVSNHRWNAVRINGKWYLIDATLDAGDNVTSASGKSIKGKFYFNYRTAFFLATPDAFINWHYPDNPEYQFLEKPIDKQTFLNTLFLTPDFYDYLIPITHIKPLTTVDSSIELSFKLRYRGKMWLEIIDSEYKIINTYISETENDIAKLYVIFPKPGKYRLNLLVDSPDNNFKAGVGQIGIEARNKSEEIIPEKYSSWKDIYELISPRTFKPEVPFTIKIKLPSVTKIALNINSGWVTYEPVGDSIFEVKIQAMRKGTKFNLYIPGENGKGWTGILKFSTVQN